MNNNINNNTRIRLAVIIFNFIFPTRQIERDIFLILFDRASPSIALRVRRWSTEHVYLVHTQDKEKCPEIIYIIRSAFRAHILTIFVVRFRVKDKQKNKTVEKR